MDNKKITIYQDYQMEPQKQGANGTRLKAFVGRSFLEEDKKVWHELRDILDSYKTLGFSYEDGQEGQLRAISEKVKELIRRNEIYIAVLTKRYAVWEPPETLLEQWLRRKSYVPNKWTRSEWVIEEIGYAIGRNMKVLALIEAGVHFPASDLDGDTQWIRFDRGNLSASQTEITQMIMKLLSERVQDFTPPEPGAVATPVSEITQESKETGPSISERFSQFLACLDSGDTAQADSIQEELLIDPENDNFFNEVFFLGVRARRGDGFSLDKLKKMLETSPENEELLIEIASIYNKFQQPLKIISLLEPRLKDSSVSLKTTLASALNDSGNSEAAYSLLTSALRSETNESRQVEFLRALARIAKANKSTALEIAFLEKLIAISPSETEERFRLAYAYSEEEGENLKKFSAFHYRLLTPGNLGAVNNLGIVYKELDFKAKAFELQKSISEKYLLAKANIAGEYGEAGMLEEAKRLAKQVIASTNEAMPDYELAVDRAQYVLAEASKRLDREMEGIKEIDGKIKNQQNFLYRYVDA